MRVSVYNLGYRLREFLKAIHHNEDVTILYHGKVIGAIKPKISRSRRRILDHPFFNMYSSKKAAHEVLADLRRDRYRAV